MSKILMVASEAVPFVKSGGLADVVGALPAALVAGGDEVAVVLPRYGSIPLSETRRVHENLIIWLGSTSYSTDIYVVSERGVRFLLVDCPPLYDRDGLYTFGGRDHPDNDIRFAVLCRAALEIARYLFRPEIIHCHDWQASLVAPYLRHTFVNDPTFLGAKTLLTIHNLGYPGRFGREALPRIGLDDSLYNPGALEFRGEISLLKGGIQFADAINTVSKSYAREIQTPEYGFGLDDRLRARADVLTGIPNGADYGEWNPETDSHIAANYSAENLSGKRICKRDLLQEFGLPSEDLEQPVLGIVSRMAVHKGFDLIADIQDELVTEDLFLVILGTGEARFEDGFRGLADEHPRKVGVRIGYDNRLAHKIEAGSDMFLMPSRYEPSGLNQIYSLRYGAVPVVRATGGLDDSIDSTTGFKFQDYEPEALLDTIRAALRAFPDKPRWKAMMRCGMAKDYSWESSAAEYSVLYEQIVG